MKTILNSGFLIISLILILSASAVLRSIPADFMASWLVVTYPESHGKDESKKGFPTTLVNECMPASRLNNEIFINRI